MRELIISVIRTTKYKCNGLQVKITLMSKRGNISWSMTYYMTMVHVITYRKEICVVGVRVGEYFSV